MEDEQRLVFQAGFSAWAGLLGWAIGHTMRVGHDQGGSMSAQQNSTAPHGAKFVRYAVVIAWIAGVRCGLDIWVFLTDPVPWRGFLPHWLRGGIMLIGAVSATLAAYLMMRAVTAAYERDHSNGLNE